MVATLEALLKLRDEMSGPLRNADRQMGQMASPGGGMGSLAKTALGTAGGFIAAQASLATLEKGLSASVGAAMQFEAQLAQIRALTGATRKDTDMLEVSIREMQETLPKSSAELGAGAYFILSSGITDAADAAEVLEIAAKASTVGLGETEVVADALTTVLNAYGLEATEAGRVTDVLMQAVKDGKAEASAFSNVLGTVVPMAAQLGISFEEVAANLATFTRLGVSAEEAATGLRGVMNQLLSPSAEAKTLLAGVGLTADELRAAIRERGLAVTLQDLIAKFEGNEEALSTLFPEVRGLTNVLATAGVQADAYNEILGNMATATGNLEKGFAEVSDTAQFKTKKALNDLNVELEEMGKDALPVVVQGAKALTVSIEIVAGAFADAYTPIRLLQEGLRELQKQAGLMPPDFEAQIATFEDWLAAGEKMGLSNRQNIQSLVEWRQGLGQSREELIGVLEQMGLTSDEIVIAKQKYNELTRAEEEAASAARDRVTPDLATTRDTLIEVQQEADTARDALFKMFKEPTAEEAAAELAISQLELQMAGLKDQLVPLTEEQKAWLDSLDLSGQQAEITRLMTQGLTHEQATMFVTLRDNLIPEQRDHLDHLIATRDAASLEAQAKVNTLPSQEAWRLKVDEQTGALLGLQTKAGEMSAVSLPTLGASISDVGTRAQIARVDAELYREALKSIPAEVTTILSLRANLTEIEQRLFSGGSVIPGQYGFLGEVTRPTLFLAGEGGHRDSVSITPGGLAARAIMINVYGAEGQSVQQLALEVRDELRELLRRGI